VIDLTTDLARDSHAARLARSVPETGVARHAACNPHVMRGWLLGAVMLTCCDGSRRADPARSSAPPAVHPRAAQADQVAPQDGPLRLETFQPPKGPPTFVLRGGQRGPGRLVFLHGMCGHGLGYAQAFPRAAAAHGTLIAPQGDVSCGGPWSQWSADVRELDRRITEAFSSLGLAEGPPIWVMGLSQGATRAVELARKWPTRYTHLVAIAAPTPTSPSGLRQLRAAVFMAGDRDRRDLMLQSQRALGGAGIPSLFLVMPEAPHGSLGREPEQTMATALTFLNQQSTGAEGEVLQSGEKSAAPRDGISKK
jgi:pimeloyl-ACP methyl ester carboxylesterase